MKEVPRTPRKVEGNPTPFTIQDHMILEHNKILPVPPKDDAQLFHITEGHKGNIRNTGGDADSLHVHVSEVVKENVQPQPWKLRLPRRGKE